MKFRVAAVLALVTLLLLPFRATPSMAEEQPAPPRLVVQIVIDQFRADYLTRFNDLYLPAEQGSRVGGFRYLQEKGAWYPDCRFDHYRTVTAVGHSVIGAGAEPWVSGMVGNSWWDASAAQVVYCVADPKAQVVGALPGSKETPMSAANLLVTTAVDELELATGGRSRTVALALKDRAAILLAGHRADAVIWFDETTGGWVSSTAYCRDGQLPTWVAAVNARKIPDQARASTWQPSVSAAALARVTPLRGGERAFSHALGKDYLTAVSSPAGNAYVFETARQAVLGEGLGKDDIPDILSINLSSNDYVGHRYGPDSAEVLDISVQTDHELAEFLNFLQAQVPGGLAHVTFAVCADHGVSTIPELNEEAGVPAGRAISKEIAAAAEKALDDTVGAAEWIASTENGEIYFSPAAVARFPQVPRAQLERVAADAVRRVTGVFFAIGKSAVLAGEVPHTSLGTQFSEAVHPRRSGDVLVILDPHWLAGSAPPGTGASHGSPFTQDAQVPLLIAGTGIRPGTYGLPVSPAQWAPSLCYLLGISRPSGCVAPLLPGLENVRD